MPKYSEKVVCPDCGLEYAYSNVSAHRKTKKHLAGRPVQVVSVGEQKEVRPENIEIKIPVAPVFTLVLDEKKIVKPFPIDNAYQIAQIEEIKESLFDSKTRLMQPTDDLKFFRNEVNVDRKFYSTDYNAIEQGILKEYKRLVFKITSIDFEFDSKYNRKNNKQRNLDMKNHPEYKKIFDAGLKPVGSPTVTFVCMKARGVYRNVLGPKLRYDDYDDVDPGESDKWNRGGGGTTGKLILNIEVLDESYAEYKDKKEEKKNKAKKNKAIAYFDYFNTTEIDLSKYQIYPEISEAKYEMCLIHSLRLSGICQNDLMKVIAHISTVTKSKTGVVYKPVEYFRINKFEEIAQIIKKKINIEYCRNKIRDDINYEIRTKIFGNEFSETINLGMFENHLFVNDQLPYTKYSLTNYNEVKNKKNWNTIYSVNRSHKNVMLSTCTVVCLLFNAGYFKPITKIKINNINGVYEFTNSELLNTIDSDQRLFNPIEKNNSSRDVFYADLENINNTNSINIPFMAGIVSEFGQPVLYTGLNCVTDMFDYIVSISKNPVVYFHNLKYDFNLMKNCTQILKICEKKNSIYSVTINHKGIKILLKDSYKLFNKSLDDFGKCFKLLVEKSKGIAYDFYTVKNINETKHSINEYIDYLKPGEEKYFLENIKDKYENNGLTFNAIDYYKYYLNLDVLVLQGSMNKFNELMVSTFKMSIHDYLTISSYADNYFINQGCYKDIFEVCGNLRKYLSNAIYGGRVSVLEKVRKTCVNDRVNDFDGVSLYPSAIKRLCNETGLPKGPCSRWNSNIDIFKVSMAVITICITKINKKQNNPFIAYRHDSKIDYINELTGPLVVVIDRTTLEDYIKYHEIEYTILDGVFWNSGFNNTFGQKIEFMFNERLKQKSLKTVEGDILQEIYKLMMNSSYGKTILSMTEGQFIIKQEKEFLRYMFSNYLTVQDAKMLNDRQYLIKEHRVDNSYNRSIVGINILSMSKRIMNEVMGLASDNEIDIFYCDTDSMHLLDRNIPKLEKLFKEKYNRELIGGKMGQFHSDFKLGNCKNVVAIRSYFLGRKCYMDVLEGENMDGKIENGHHVRMKGISENGFNEASKGDPENIYRRLCNDETIKFNLSSSDSVRFKFTSRGVEKIEVDTFYRNVKF